MWPRFVDVASVGWYPFSIGFSEGFAISTAAANAPEVALTQRQSEVLRVMVNAYVGEAGPIGSGTLAKLLPMSVSSASIRTVLAELAEKGLVEKPHASSGRIPTERGLRSFVDSLVDADELGAYERRTISYSMGVADADSVVSVASQLLSERTHQLGFVVTPRLDRVILQHVSLVRLSTERLLVVFVSQAGTPYRRVIDDEWMFAQAELDQIAALLNERVVGRTLREVRDVLASEADAARARADRLLNDVIELGSRALAASAEGDEPMDLVIASRLALLNQPEFRDPRRVQELFAAVETKERILEVLDRMLAEGGVQVAFGDEVDAPGLHRCALVATHYGQDEDAPLGVLGVIGPSRMDYARVISLVDFLSRVVTDKLIA